MYIEKLELLYMLYDTLDLQMDERYGLIPIYLHLHIYQSYIW